MPLIRPTSNSTHQYEAIWDRIGLNSAFLTGLLPGGSVQLLERLLQVLSVLGHGAVSLEVEVNSYPTVAPPARRQ
jgi:hypothetical protein